MRCQIIDPKPPHVNAQALRIGYVTIGACTLKNGCHSLTDISYCKIPSSFDFRTFAMSIRVAAIVFFATLLLPVAASALTSGASEKPGDDERVERIDDVDEYVQRTRDVIEGAREGIYGKIRKRDMDRVVQSQEQIEALLADRKGPVTLTHDEQIQLTNAQEAINAIIQADDKSRIVCTRAKVIGTRFAQTECVTVAERERRADVARRIIRTANDFCVPGEGNACAK
jgi:hypothetical protein